MKVTDKETEKQDQLLTRLEAWLLQQPEYPLLFLADRDTRKRTAHIVSRSLMTLPKRQGGYTIPRKVRRSKDFKAAMKRLSEQAT